MIVAGVTGAKAATLAFLVGGTEGAFARAEPFLAHMGRRIVHCGPSGSGLVAKICNNLMLGIQQVATAEAMLLGEELGLDPGTVNIAASLLRRCFRPMYLTCTAQRFWLPSSIGTPSS